MYKILTICIAAYNVERYIKQCLDSIIKCKNIKDIEVLVVDDGGTDNTLNIAKEYENKYQGIVIPIHKENGGWGSTLNYGVIAAKGKYFKQLDGDDYFDTNNLDALVNYLKECNDDLVYTPYCEFTDNQDEKILIENNDLILEEKKRYCTEDVIEKMKIHMHMSTIKTDLIRDIKLLENCFYTDIEFVVKALDRCQNMSFLNAPVYMYRIGREGQSVSIEGIKKHYTEHEKVLFETLKYTNSIPEEKKRNAFRERLKKMADAQFGFYLLIEINKNNKINLIAFDKKVNYLFGEKIRYKSKIVKLCKYSNFFLYRMAAHYYQVRNKK